MLLHEVDSALLGKYREGWDTADMMARCIVHHWYHLHARIVTGSKRYNFIGYPFHKHLIIHVIMVVSCTRIRYPYCPGSERKRSGGLVGSFYVHRIDVRGIALPFDIFNRPPFDHVKITQRIILRDSMNEDQNPAS